MFNKEYDQIIGLFLSLLLVDLNMYIYIKFLLTLTRT